MEFIDLSGKIHEDPRGFVFFPWQEGVKEAQDLLRTFHLISIAPGEVRGNHLHPGHREYLFTFQGTAVLTWEEQPGEAPGTAARRQPHFGQHSSGHRPRPAESGTGDSLNAGLAGEGQERFRRTGNHIPSTNLR